MIVEITPRSALALLGMADLEGVPYRFKRDVPKGSKPSGNVLSLKLDSPDWNGPDPVIAITVDHLGNAEVKFYLEHMITPGGGS